MSDRETGDDVLRDLLRWALEDCRLSANQTRTIAARYVLVERSSPVCALAADGFSCTNPDPDHRATQHGGRPVLPQPARPNP